MPSLFTWAECRLPAMGEWETPPLWTLWGWEACKQLARPVNS